MTEPENQDDFSPQEKQPKSDNARPPETALEAALSLALAAGSVVFYALQHHFFSLIIAASAIAMGLYALQSIFRNPKDKRGADLAFMGMAIALALLCLLFFQKTMELTAKEPPPQPLKKPKEKKPFQKVFVTEDGRYFILDPSKFKQQYTDDLGKLIKIDKTLTEDKSITFKFLHASEAGFTFYTTHADGSGKQFTFTD